MSKKLILKELCRYNIGTYADIIYRNALLYPDKEVFIYGEKRLTFSNFNARVNRLVHLLQSMNLKKGDKIGILSWNCIECTEITGAAMKGGFVVVPFNPRFQINELDYIIHDSQVKVIFTGKELIPIVLMLKEKFSGIEFISLEEKSPEMSFYDELINNFTDAEPDVDVTEDDPFIIFYTSGTTGIPRGAIYTHYKKLEEARTKAILGGLRHDNIHVMILPLFHIGGWSHFWTFFMVGGTNIIMPNRSFDPAATLKVIEKERATDIHIVPTQLAMFLSLPDVEKYDLSSLKQIWYAASPMPLELLKKGMARFGPVFGQGYGQTESGPDISILPLEDHKVIYKSEEEQKILASCGQPCLWVHARIVDDKGADVEPYQVGEIIVKSKSVMVGYWNKPDYTKETIVNSWLHTGDMGYYDEKGYMYIVDRKKDLIISGGENVYPREVEEILYKHPSVMEAAVIGVPDEKWVERVHAVVVLKKGAQVTADEIINFCKERIAKYKAPRSVEFVDALPKNPQGKILKRELRARYVKKE
ncbi:MAG TPA: long-chain-fatty-acid--CoA ligase [Syntrophorhabdaceae bacterium]|nr:long-chain-fatty-acid--CoA ligase [Syntrophorhabdaceae bacterium]